MNNPTIVLVSSRTWTGNDRKPHRSESFEVRGGAITPEWLKGLRVPSLPWCEVGVGSSDWEAVPREQGGGVWLSSWGGEVWPSAWPELFEAGPRGVRMTLLGEELFAAARELGTLKATASAQVAQYPQYAGYFDRYTLGRIKRDVCTKLGMAFTAGEVVLVAPVSTFRFPNAPQFVMAWSMRNGVDTSVSASDVEPYMKDGARGAQ